MTRCPDRIGDFPAGVEVVAGEIGLRFPLPPASLIGVDYLFEPDVLVEVEATAILMRASVPAEMRPLGTGLRCGLPGSGADYHLITGPRPGYARDMEARAKVAAVLAAVTVAALSAACSDIEKAVNKGGDTRCSEYTAQDSPERHTTVTKYLEQERGKDGVDQDTVDLAAAAIDLMCSAQANPDTPIRDADLTGILVPK